MGTRSLTRFIKRPTKGDLENEQILLTVYQQYDGYPAGVGANIAAFLSARMVVNGISGDRTTCANGMECLAALFVSEFKGDEAGNLYIYPHDAQPQEWNYEILQDGWQGELRVSVYDGPWRIFGSGELPNAETRRKGSDKPLFSGTVEEFAEWVKEGGDG